MTTLTEYLSSLNTTESSWSLYVNPENYDDFRIGQNCFENGGVLDEFVPVATLDKLSYGYQSEHDAFCCFVSEGLTSENMPQTASLFIKGRTVKINPQAIYDAWVKGNLDSDFAQVIEDGVTAIQEQWARDESSHFVSDTLPTIISAKQECLTY